jgi:hypothetical protein
MITRNIKAKNIRKRREAEKVVKKRVLINIETNGKIQRKEVRIRTTPEIIVQNIENK